MVPRQLGTCAIRVQDRLMMVIQGAIKALLSDDRAQDLPGPRLAGSIARGE